MLIKAKVFGQRFCTRCGTTQMYYYTIEGQPEGSCQRCGNIDYCDDETEQQVKQRFGNLLRKADIDTLIFQE